MHDLTLDSGSCPACGIENSKHLLVCHGCKKPLPWANEEVVRQQENAQIEARHNRSRGNAERAVLMIVGAALFVMGVCLWCGNVFHLYVTFAGAGYLSMLVGGALFKIGNMD